MNYKYYMNEAYKEAQLAYAKNEVPIGAIVVYKNKIIGRGHNLRQSKKSSIFHGEIIAINEACQFLNDWRLEGCTIFITIEPCTMCAGAIIQSRISEVVFGATNKKFGAVKSLYSIFDNEKSNHKVNVINGVMEEECRQIMKEYFKKFRQKKNL